MNRDAKPPAGGAPAGFLNSLARLRRGAFLAGALLLAAAVFNVLHFASMDWYPRPILRASAIAAVELVLLFAVLELVAWRRRGPRAQYVLFVFAVIPALWPPLEIFVGAWLGRETASVETWHLTEWFAVVNFVAALVVAAILVAIGAIIVARRNAVRHRA